MVGGNTIEALRAGCQATKDISAADHDGDLDAELVNILNLAGNSLNDLRLDAEALIAHQRFAAEFQQHPVDIWVFP